MSEVRVRTSRTSPSAAVLMIVLGAITLFTVNGLLGTALIILGVGMYLFNMRVNSRRNARRKSNFEAQGFSRTGQDEPGQAVVAQRGVVKIPCKRCGTLLDPVGDAECPSCGEKVTPSR